jgi:hypothetical protein
VHDIVRNTDRNVNFSVLHNLPVLLPQKDNFPIRRLSASIETFSFDMQGRTATRKEHIFDSVTTPYIQMSSTVDQ